MEKAIEKAAALIEAMEYIRRFRDRLVVVKLGGSILEDLQLQRKLLTDIVFMATVGMRPIIVHGGGKAITKAMAEAGLEPVWVHGRRYTDQRTLAIAEHTLVNTINTPICEAEQFFMVLKKMGVESRMVRYVDDGHGVRKKPANYLDSLRRTIAWFERYV